jgi:hypothetical protein
MPDLCVRVSFRAAETDSNKLWDVIRESWVNELLTVTVLNEYQIVLRLWSQMGLVTFC